MVQGLSDEVVAQLDAIDDLYENADTEDNDPRRLEFQAILEYVLGSTFVYFVSKPEDLRTEMQYPCLVYEIDSIQRTSADNLAYKSTPRYQVTFIRKNKADRSVIHKLHALPNSSFSRHFVTSNYIHDVFTIYH